MVSIFELSIVNYKRAVDATVDVMELGEQYFNEQGLDLSDIVTMQLAPDMAPFPFQVNSVRHHSLGSIQGIIAGEFSTPPRIPEMDYSALIGFLKEASAELNAFDAEVVNALEGKAMYFRASSFELPFVAENFVQSFSLPNLYFHATTIYDMLRIKGVPLSKSHFMGRMAVGLPE